MHHDAWEVWQITQKCLVGIRCTRCIRPHGKVHDLCM